MGGIQSADVNNIGLKFFISSKAELVDYQIISQLSDIEAHTNSLDEKMIQMIDFIYDNNTDKNEIIKTKFISFLSNIVNGEKELLKLYAKFDEENKNNLQP